MGNGDSARVHSMDALRASTMMLLVPVHAAGLLSLNGHEGAWATVLYWAVHVFRMPLFFAMSGFFMALMLSRKGLGKTLRNRSGRIALPMAIGVVTLVPLMLFAAQATGTAMTPNRPEPAGSPFSFEPGFLWFLWYLLIIDAAAIAVYVLAPGALRAAGGRLRRLVAHPLLGVMPLAALTALTLWPSETWMAASSPESWVPDVPALAYYGIFFCLGAILHTHRDLVAGAGRAAWRWAACAVAATIPAGILFSLHNSPALGSRPLVHGAALLIYATATWASLLALVGLAQRYLNRPRPALRYLADSSYWIYLSHLPPLVLIVALLGPTALGTPTAFVLATAAAIGFSLLTYPLFVRYTVVGRLLNGPRARSGGRRAPGLLRPRPATAVD